MDRISGISRILETLSKRVSDSTTRSTRNKTAQASHKKSKTTLVELEHQIIERMKGFDLNDKSQQLKSYNIFLESVLSWEFGENLKQEPRFHELIHEVNTLINEDPKLKEKFNSLLSEFTSV